MVHIHDMRMHLHIAAIITCAFRAQGIRFPCGPDEKCLCANTPDNATVMDCSFRSVDVCDICKNTDTGVYLIEIDASSTGALNTLRKGCFEGCYTLKSLLLKNNSIKDIYKDVFRDVRQIETLDLGFNKLNIYTGAKPAFLQRLINITYLAIKGNLISDVNVSGYQYPDLSDLTQLVFLSIDGLPDSNFGESYKGLKRLKVVDISGENTLCILNQLTNDTFKHLPTSVTSLELSNCSIVNIYAGTFVGLSELRRINLSGNRQLGFAPLRNISYGLQFTRIDFLNLSNAHTTFGVGKKVSKRDICYFRNTTLREIDVSGNRIQVFETNSILLLPTTLQVVRINDNIFTFGPFLLQMPCLTNVSEAYANFQHLNHDPSRYLKEPFDEAPFVGSTIDDCPFAADDYLRNISKEIERCPYFDSEKVSVDQLQAAAFPRKLKTLTCVKCDVQSRLNRYPIFPVSHLSYADLSGNIFDTWIGPIGPFPSLKVLNMSRNYCSYIGPDFFYYFERLETLILADNFLGIPFQKDTTGHIFRQLGDLKYLDVSKNQIQYIPSKIFQHLTNLEGLDISTNNIGTWTVDLTRMVNLTKLNVRSNALHSLPADLTSHLESVSTMRKIPFEIDMRSNPIKVSCDNRLFLEWMLKFKKSFVGFTGYNFLNDQGHRLTKAKFIEEVHGLKKTCRSYTVAVIVCTLGLSVFLAIVVGGIAYRNRWKLRYILYMNKRRFLCYRAIPDYEPIENYKYDAFISYTEEDVRFVLDELIPSMENQGYSLCIHQRDFVAGHAVTDNIINAIQSSRKTVILLSREYLKSRWCVYEFHMARMESIYSRDGKGCLVIVMLEDVPPSHGMPLEMIEWIKQKSYIEYTDNEEGEVLFWEKLKEAIVE